jgi:hypothetical protein
MAPGLVGQTIERAGRYKGMRLAMEGDLRAATARPVAQHGSQRRVPPC